MLITLAYRNLSLANNEVQGCLASKARRIIGHEQGVANAGRSSKWSWPSFGRALLGLGSLAWSPVPALFGVVGVILIGLLPIGLYSSTFTGSIGSTVFSLALLLGLAALIALQKVLSEDLKLARHDRQVFEARLEVRSRDALDRAAGIASEIVAEF
jgi:hypothetical protein